VKIEYSYPIIISLIHINEHHILDLYSMILNDHGAVEKHQMNQCVCEDSEKAIDDTSELCLVQVDSSGQDSSYGSTCQDDVHCHGSQFIMTWLLRFTKGTLEVKFDIIYLVVIVGIQWEGRLANVDQRKLDTIIGEIETARNDVKTKSECERIEHLSKCCVKQYTKESFVFRVINETLRDNNLDKLNTIGPLCYLIFNYIGGRTHVNQSLQFRFHQLAQSAKSLVLNLYRGDYASNEILDAYRQAAGQDERYFRWISFVSTSNDRRVAECYATNTLYIIELSRATSSDQFVDLDGLAVITDEAEVLLRPGSRFRVEEITSSSILALNVVKIKIVLSFMYTIQG
jgi:hypothetical protein